uniref:Glycosyltransferase n=1 Tax=viral metagenome TaxID=1070528 RepID=A0A6C0I0R8_9ZZZZ
MFFKYIKKNYIFIILLFLLIIGIFFYNSSYNNKELFTQQRKAYILTCDETSNRSQFSKSVLENIGFNVIFFKCIKNENKVLSNKISMQAIYEIIANGQDEWVYVFEDDINVLEDIKIDELIEYENISKTFFYLGTCGFENINNLYHPTKINGHEVAIVKGLVRGLHAIALSKDGAKELLEYSSNSSEIYMDMILEEFSQIHNPNLVRYDLESYIQGHRGIVFQDRDKFPTTI